MLSVNFSVAGPGVEPGLGDYEPPVRLYTTPRVLAYFYIIRDLASSQKWLYLYTHDIIFAYATKTKASS